MATSKEIRRPLVPRSSSHRRRNLRKLGVAVSVAMKTSGHKTSSIFRRYDIVDMADLADASARRMRSKNPNRLSNPVRSGFGAELPKKALRIVQSPISDPWRLSFLI